MRIAATILLAALILPLAATSAEPCHAEFYVKKLCPDDPLQDFVFEVYDPDGQWLPTTFTLVDGAEMPFYTSSLSEPFPVGIRELDPDGDWSLATITYSGNVTPVIDIVCRKAEFSVENGDRLWLTFTNVREIPEPATLGMVGLGLVALVIVRRRRRR